MFSAKCTFLHTGMEKDITELEFSERALFLSMILASKAAYKAWGRGEFHRR